MKVGEGIKAKIEAISMMGNGITEKGMEKDNKE